MSKARMWTFGLLIGLLASGDWFLNVAPADGKDNAGPEMKIGKASIRAVEREIKVGDKKETHTFIEVKGEFKGKIKLRIMNTELLTLSRMMPRPRKVWEKEITIDTSKSRSIDLGVLPQSGKLNAGTLEASTNGMVYIALLSMGGFNLKALSNPSRLGNK